jgi:CheY-like chemotaxis protein
MVVDDDEDNLELFSAILEGQGFAVDPYLDSVKALRKFRPNYYDLSILDYRMPTLNGLELFEEMRGIDSSIKAILLTANYEQLYHKRVQELLDESVMKVVKKPVTVSGLMLEINSILDTNVKSSYTLIQ